MQLRALAAVSILSLIGPYTLAAPVQELRTAAENVANRASITWTGRIFAERDEYTLYGDVMSLHKQIRDIRPDYDPFEFEELAIRNATLAKRHKSGGNCGTFANAYSYDVGSMLDYLGGIGGACRVDANACSRLTCVDTSGIYLCNGPTAIAPSCLYIYGYANDIWLSCNKGGYDGDGVSGQEWDSDGYNVVVAYANCNDPSSVPPSGYAGPGPNGPAYQCTNCITAASNDPA